jgi:DNA replication protein DnaC
MTEPKPIGELLQKSTTAPTSEPSDIDLTEEEIKAAIDAARIKKQALHREREYWSKVKKEEEIPTFTPEKLLEWSIKRYLHKHNMQVITDSSNETIVKELSRYFTGGGTLNQQKGILLAGNVGCGKTTIMRMFALNPKSSFHIVSCRKPASEFADKEYGGFSAIEKYFTYQRAGQDNPFRHAEFGMCFDDLGTENQRKHFGNEANVMEEIILSRYDIPALHRMTHITTNLTADQIKEYYGPRVASRMKEMFNILSFNPQSPDRRK